MKIKSQIRSAPLFLLHSTIIFLNPKFQAFSHLLWLYSLASVGPARKLKTDFPAMRLNYQSSGTILLACDTVISCLIFLTMSVNVIQQYESHCNKFNIVAYALMVDSDETIQS